MKPFVAKVNWTDELVLVIGFTATGDPIIVHEGGQVSVLDDMGVVVDRPSMDWPVGYRFSRVENEQEVPA